MLHKGASKEKYLAPPHDLNHFDTNHAEVELILTALNQGLNLTNASLYINLLPCPICARMLARTPIKEIIYQHDHSQGYGFKLLTQAGKTLRRIPAS
jgi:deoxycytidylate deaminase